MAIWMKKSPPTLFESKKFILGALVSLCGKDANWAQDCLYCNICGLKIFGKGSLIRMDTWEDRCRCVEGRGTTMNHVAMHDRGCLFVWNEVEV